MKILNLILLPLALNFIFCGNIFADESDAIKHANIISAPEEKERIADQISWLITHFRSVYKKESKALNDRGMEATETMLQENTEAKEKIDKYFSEFNPNERGKNLEVSVEIISIEEESSNKWVVKWKETEKPLPYNDSKNTSFNMVAHLEIDFLPKETLYKRSPNEIQYNMKGLIVKKIDWNKE